MRTPFPNGSHPSLGLSKMPWIEFGTCLLVLAAEAFPIKASDAGKAPGPNRPPMRSSPHTAIFVSESLDTLGNG